MKFPKKSAVNIMIFLTSQQIAAFQANPTTNPLTGRTILIHGDVYNDLRKACEKKKSVDVSNPEECRKYMKNHSIYVRAQRKFEEQMLLMKNTRIHGKKTATSKV